MSHTNSFQGAGELSGNADDIAQLEGSLRGLLMGSSPDTRTPPQRQSQIAGPTGPLGFSFDPKSVTKSPHKRLNQKERRLLAAQLAVPVNQRASVSTQPTQSTASTAQEEIPFSRQANESSWRQSEPRFLQHQPQQRYSQNEHFRSSQPQPHLEQGLHQTHIHHGQSIDSHQGPHQRWAQSQTGLTHNLRPPEQFQGQRQWRTLQGQPPHQAPQAVQAPAFQDLQFQHRGPPPRPTRALYQPGIQGQSTPQVKPDMIIAQCEFLESLLHAIVQDVGVEESEVVEKEAFRQEVEHICRDAITKYELEIGNKTFLPQSVELRCFGSTASGFATKASDMDLALLTPLSHVSGDSADSPIPRVMEKALLDRGYGARLLTRTRVPIIKLCQKPTPVLMGELRKERMKWEHGAKEVPEDEETIDGEEDVASPAEVVEVSTTGANPSLAIIPPSDTVLTEYQKTLHSLSQKTDKKILSLGDYYGKAKNVLHVLGGRDAGMSGSHALKAKEVDILEDVCEQFIRGLDDSSLREKLLRTRVIQAIINRECDASTVRSLSSLHNLVEGESLLAGWKSRPLPERNPEIEQSYEMHINAWNRLCLDNPNLRDYSANYNKLVFQFLTKIRSMSSLQLVFLKQAPAEPASSYFARVDAIRKDLNIMDTNTDNYPPCSIMVTHYINGVHNASHVRNTLEALRVEENMTLRKVATYHRILELITDYEKALEKNSYAEKDRPDIKAYVSLLRSAIHEPSQASMLVLPLTTKFEHLVRKIASLPDPANITSNDRFQSHLEFPKSGVGIQCDINFAASLALHNTQLLRCYCAADPRVKPMVLFVKHWAKRRGINTPYRGTLSSYGYVLMVLHYLVNVASPFVVPNLQLLGQEASPQLSPADQQAITVCEGRDVRFWRNEHEIHHLALRGVLTPNQEKVGSLLRGFFEYYAQSGAMSHVPNHKGFDWGRDVLSLRTRGGIISKHEKGWVGAKTVRVVIEEGAPAPDPNPPAPAEKAKKPTEKIATKMGKKDSKDVAHIPEIKEIRHRYLFAIEDPFELEHNVARTVTHTGICKIRDELRRAWTLIRAQRNYRPGGPLDQTLFLEEKDKEGEVKKEGLVDLMKLIHGEHMVDMALAQES